jgi:hypothetical protein
MKNAKKREKRHYNKPVIKKYSIKELKKGWDYETFGISLHCGICCE